MEENVQQLLKDKNEDVVQFNFENNTSSPIAIDLFDTASLLTIPTSGTQQTTYTASNDLIPSLTRSIFALNPNNGTFVASGIVSPSLTLINTTTNTTDNNFNNIGGFDNVVTTLALQPDGKILVGGLFTTYKSITENYIIRLNSDGTKDNSFDNSIGFNIPVLSIAIQPDGKILVGGLFTTYKGVTNNFIIRLNSDGTKDTSFDNSIGFNGSVNQIVIQPDGKIVVGGLFTTYKGVTANRIIRLNTDGTKDLTFDNSIGFSNEIFAIELQSDGKILCGGQFTTYKGVTNNFIIRLNTDGSKDLTFDNSIGFSNNVLSIELQPDGKIICGGGFNFYKGITENYIIRLNTDGSKDSTFNNSIGFNADVFPIVLQPDGNILCGGQFTSYKGYVNNFIINLQSNGLSASTLNLGTTTFRDIIYESNNNFFYGLAISSLTRISSDCEFIDVVLPAFGGTSLVYNSNNNNLYILNVNQIQVVDCLLNTLVATINLGVGVSAVFLSEVTPSNEIYYFDDNANLLQKIDCLTNTLILINLSLPNSVGGNTTLNYYNGYLYLSFVSSDLIDIVDTNTDTYFNSITIPAIYTFNPYKSAINPVTNQLFITDANTLNPKQYAIIDLPTNTFVSVNSLGGVGRTNGIIYNPISNSMYISGSLFSVVTFTATPFFIGGSTNYNTFVNNLNFEPVMIQEIRILTQNQTQLYNQVQFTKIDSNGNQIFFPEFPITKVDSYQQQGNIAGLQLNGLVFDGRTYINQYVINANQIVSFEIYYKQLDRFSATPTYPIFFKDKIQLKEYIRKDYNNYDVEM